MNPSTLLPPLFAAMLLIFGLLLGWILVQHAARRLAARRPELGPAREEGGGCSLLCLCRNTAACPKHRLHRLLSPPRSPSPTLEEDPT